MKPRNKHKDLAVVIIMLLQKYQVEKTKYSSVKSQTLHIIVVSHILIVSLC